MKAPKINIKRVYEDMQTADGYRILVDRLWPRGVSKEHAHIDLWEKRIAPSSPLRRWFSHDPLLWPDFKLKYLNELKQNKCIPEIVDLIKMKKNVTLVYAAKDVEHTHALVLQSFLQKQCS
ncbi:MAG: DUF488 family protein [Bacteroidetes bacterium]|nr:DUF488 family protein [Bacteroidota bacterium]